MTRRREVADAARAILARIEEAAERAKRPAGSVTLVAASKTHPAEDLLAAYEGGVRHFGENRVQEALAKLPALPADAVKHLIGPLQSNKVNKAVELFDVVQTVGSIEIARRLDRAAASRGRRLPVFLEVNLGGEATKAGLPEEELPGLVEVSRELSAIEVRGLMAIPPPGDTRPYFRRLRALADRFGLTELSMGMSDDYEVAIEEGATFVRVGTALFGRRE